MNERQKALARGCVEAQDVLMRQREEREGRD